MPETLVAGFSAVGSGIGSAGSAIAGAVGSATAGSSLAGTLGAAASAASAGLAISNALNQPKQPTAPTVKAPVALPNPAAVQQQETTLAAQAVNQSGRQSTLLTSPLGTTGATTLGG